jgi:hypothetical protein
MKFWILQKQKPADREIFDFVGQKTDPPPDSKIFRIRKTRISVGVGKFADQVTVISMTWGRPTPLFGAVGRGSALLVVCCLFVVLWIYHSQNALHARRPADCL